MGTSKMLLGSCVKEQTNARFLLVTNLFKKLIKKAFLYLFKQILLIL